MLNRKIVTAVLLATIIVCIAALQTKAADISKSLVGTWRITSYERLTLETKEVSRPFGENPIGYIQYSPGGHMVVFLSAREMPKVSPPFSDADQAAIYSKFSVPMQARTVSMATRSRTTLLLPTYRIGLVGTRSDL